MVSLVWTFRLAPNKHFRTARARLESKPAAGRHALWWHRKGLQSYGCNRDLALIGRPHSALRIATLQLVWCPFTFIAKTLFFAWPDAVTPPCSRCTWSAASEARCSRAPRPRPALPCQPVSPCCRAFTLTAARVPPCPKVGAEQGGLAWSCLDPFRNFPRLRTDFLGKVVLSAAGESTLPYTPAEARDG